MKKLVILGVLIVAVTSANANVYRGPGELTCGSFSAQKDAMIRGSALLWALGYLSGINAFSKVDFLVTTDAQAIDAALLLYCQNNPLENFMTSINSVADQLLSRAKK